MNFFLKLAGHSGAPAASVTGIARTAATSGRQSRIVFVAWYDSRYGSELLLPSAVVGSWGVGSSVVRGQFNCGMVASQRKEPTLFRLAKYLHRAMYCSLVKYPRCST